MEADLVIVRYFAAARATAGRAEEHVEAATIADLVAALSGRGEELARILAVASFLVDGLLWRDHDAPLPPGVTVDVLPPFAGG